MQIRNLFLTRTALGVYATILGAIAVAGTNLAHKYDESGGRLKATDWVLAGCGVLTAISGQAIVLASKVGSNGSLTYTPRGIWGPNREDVESQAQDLTSLSAEPVAHYSFPSEPERAPEIVSEPAVNNFDGYRGE